MAATGKPSQLEQAFGLFDDSDDEETQFTVPIAPVELKVQPNAIASDDARPTDTASKDVVQLWHKNKPEIVGPIEFQEGLGNIGGARGFVAKTDIEPGTLLLIERVFLQWPALAITPSEDDEEKEDQEEEDFQNKNVLLFGETLKRILSEKDTRDAIMKDLKPLYPEVLADVPAATFEQGVKDYQSLIESILEEQKKEDESFPYNYDDLLRIMFALQSNGFASGVFLNCAMFNHTCSPNAIKFTPEDDSTISEVRATASIKKGEAITVSYLYPREQSRRMRRQGLKRQFGFDCECDLCMQDKEENIPEKYMEIEKQVIAAERILEEKRAPNALAAAIELLSDTLEIVPHDYLPLMRLHRLVANSSAALLKLKTKEFQDHAILFLRSNMELLDLQKKYLSSEHTDFARTYQDISQGIQILLAYDAQVLYSEFPEWPSFKAASHAENHHRKEYRRIKQLYE